MSLVSVKALILRANPATDSDRYVRLLSKDLGLTEAYARGALRSKSPLLATTEAFGLCEFTLFYNKEKYYVNQANFVYPFAKLKKSIEGLTAASHLADVAVDVSQSLEENQGLYELMVYAFYALEQASLGTVEKILQVTHAAEVRLLALAGYALDYSVCPHCALALSEVKELYFSFPQMRFLCKTAAEKERRELLQWPRSPGSSVGQGKRWELVSGKYLGQPIWPVSETLFEALQYFSKAPYVRLFTFKVSNALEKELAAFTQAYLTACLEKNYQKLGFLFQLSGI